MRPSTTQKLDYIFAGYPNRAKGELVMNNRKPLEQSPVIHQNEESNSTRGAETEALTFINPSHGGLGM
jgi:hypothetical protein